MSSSNDKRISDSVCALHQAVVNSLLICLDYIFHLLSFGKFLGVLPSHDASHLGVDVIFLSSILDGAAEKSKDSDELVSAEEPKVVDRVATFFEEAVFIRVVADDSFEVSIGGLLAQEGACMRKN